MNEGRCYVLVHGAYHGGWCWRHVADFLISRGERVFTPTLTGLGERSHLISTEIGLSTHVQDIVNLIRWEELNNIILCGHSYGGMVISGVAEIVTEHIQSLVYLDAIKPAPSTCLWDYLTPQSREFFDLTTNSGYIAPVPAIQFAAKEENQAWIDRLCTPQPRNTFLERLPATNIRASISNNVYVYAGQYASEVMRGFAEEAEREAGWTRVDLPFGHDLMIDAPTEVGQLLYSAARSCQTRVVPS